MSVKRRQCVRTTKVCCIHHAQAGTQTAATHTPVGVDDVDENVVCPSSPPRSACGIYNGQLAAIIVKEESRNDVLIILKARLRT
jgi:hypothetical protein